MANNLAKYFHVRNYWQFILGRLLPSNLLLNRFAHAISFDELRKLRGIEVIYFNVDNNEYKNWVKAHFPGWENIYGCVHHKKLIEFFTSYNYLEPGSADVFMDAGGGKNSYLTNLRCKRKILHDIRISQHVKSYFGEEVDCVESDAANIPLPDESVDKISCHHSFEHFQGRSDSLFLGEIQRLLKIGGKCCIIQIFIGEHYLEATDRFLLNRKFDNRAKRLIDPTATLPGGDFSGNFARIYDLSAFQDRVINCIDLSKFKVTIGELIMEGNMVPDLKLNCHKRVAQINQPYRAMFIERLK